MTEYLRTRFVLLFLSSAGAATAGTMGPTIETYNPKEGLYLGAGIAASLNNDQEKVTNLANKYSVKVASNATRAVGNAFLGYGHTFSNALYLGVESNIYSPREVRINNRPGAVDTTLLFNDEFSINDYFSGDLLPGYRLNSSLLVYGRAGFAFRSTAFSQQAVVGEAVSVDETTNTIGGRFGVGTTYALNKKLAISADYFYSYAPSIITDVLLKSAEFDFKSSSNYIGISLVCTV